MNPEGMDAQDQNNELMRELAHWCEQHSVHLRIVDAEDTGEPTIELCSNNNPSIGTYLLVDSEMTFP
jgi:hypothetical protein